MQASQHVLQQSSGVNLRLRRCMHRPGMQMWSIRAQQSTLARQRSQARPQTHACKNHLQVRQISSIAKVLCHQVKRHNGCTVTSRHRCQVRCAAAAEQVSHCEVTNSHPPSSSKHIAFMTFTNCRRRLFSLCLQTALSSRWQREPNANTS